MRFDTRFTRHPNRVKPRWQDLSGLTVWNRPNSGDQVGLGVRILYAGGDFDLLSYNNEPHRVISFVARYDSAGELVELMGSIEDRDGFTALLDNYFTAHAG